ncbi:MAG: site-specific integrase, partial [Limnohabitans sp.]|nr:site-specific integrase [Limnohabitans sp.]
MVKKTRDPIVISDDEKKVIDQFIDHLWLEDGLAKNTLESYRFDLMQFSEFLNGNIKKILLEAHQSDIQAYLANKFSHVKARSISRLIATLRRFYRYHLRERHINEDPTLHVEAPKLPKSL